MANQRTNQIEVRDDALPTLTYKDLSNLLDHDRVDDDALRHGRLAHHVQHLLTRTHAGPKFDGERDIRELNHRGIEHSLGS
jgi:hypothetical protein